MKATMLRLLAILMVVLMLGTLLIACKDDQENPDNDPDDNPGDGNDDPNDPAADPNDYLLWLTKENLGAQINILCRTDKSYETDIDGDSATALMEKAVYNRNARIEEYLGVEIIGNPVNGSWAEKATFIETLNQSVATSDNAFQLVATHMLYNAIQTLNDQYYDIRSYDVIDYDAPWWSSSWVNEMTVYDKLFAITGDAALTMWEEMLAVYFNRDMAENLTSMPDLYQTVQDGDWTLETFSILSDIYTDNGNDQRDNTDTYGLLTNVLSVRAFATTTGLTVTERNDEGGMDLVFYDDLHKDHVEEVYAALYALLYENDGTYFNMEFDATTVEVQDMFTNGYGLFYTDVLKRAEILRHSEVSFGILPFPKYDYGQESYRSHTSDSFSSFGVPLSCTDPETSLKVLEAIGAESKYSVIPDYYEVVLEGRVAQDTGSKAMLDIIRQNLYFDFGYVYSESFKGGLDCGPYTLFGNTLRKGDESMSSVWAERYEVYLAGIEAAMEKFLNQ